MTQIFIVPDHHHKSHPVKTFSVRKYVNHDIIQHPASEHSRVSGKTCRDPRALQSQSFIKHYSCILRFLNVWHYSLKHGLSGRHLYITPLCESQSPHGRHEARCHLAFHSGETEIQNKRDRDFGSSVLDGQLQCLHHHLSFLYYLSSITSFSTTV